MYFTDYALSSAGLNENSSAQLNDTFNQSKLRLYFVSSTMTSILYLRFYWVYIGTAGLSDLQNAQEGCYFDQVFPCLLSQLSEDALRDTEPQVPQVQCHLRGERLPSHLSHLSHHRHWPCFISRDPFVPASYHCTVPFFARMVQI